MFMGLFLQSKNPGREPFDSAASYGPLISLVRPAHHSFRALLRIAIQKATLYQVGAYGWFIAAISLATVAQSISRLRGSCLLIC